MASEIAPEMARRRRRPRRRRRVGHRVGHRVGGHIWRTGRDRRGAHRRSASTSEMCTCAHVYARLCAHVCTCVHMCAHVCTRWLWCGKGACGEWGRRRVWCGVRPEVDKCTRAHVDAHVRVVAIRVIISRVMGVCEGGSYVCGPISMCGPTPVCYVCVGRRCAGQEACCRSKGASMDNGDTLRCAGGYMHACICMRWRTTKLRRRCE